MALEIKHSINEINADCESATWVDNTGIYDAIDNPGGYGSPNKERANLVAFLAAFAYVPDADDDRLVVDNSQAETADTWIVPITRDGYVYSTLLLIDRWDAGDDYVINNIVYHNSAYWKAVSDPAIGAEPGVVGTSIWAPVSDPYEERANIVDQGRNDDAIMCRVDTCYANEISRVNSPTACNRCKTAGDWIRIDALRQGAQVKCEQLQWIEADLIIRQLANICESLECDQCNPH